MGGVILKICEDFLVTDQLQFVFKQNTGYAHAIFVQKSIIIQYIVHCSSVCVGFLDRSKAFDRVNHIKLYISCYLQVLKCTLLTLNVTGAVNC